MKRKPLVIFGILIGVLVCLLVVVFPLAPLWQRLGLGVFCISGSFPNLKAGPCPQSEVVQPATLPEPGPDGPLPLIFDDDGSPDGTIALLYFLANPRFEVQAVTISYGEAHPVVFAPQVAQLLAGLGRSIPVGAGRETPLAGSNAFPDDWRQSSDGFWGLEIPQGGTAQAVVPAAQLIVDTINTSPRPVTVFISGAHTNLAEALQLDPGIAANIAGVYVMGGAVNVPGNVNSDYLPNPNKTAEWNIYVDPLAAQQVFAAGLPIHLVPLDATNQVLWTKADLPTWQTATTAEGALAAEMLDWLLRSWSPDGVYIWDLAAAVQATDPSACPETPVALEVVTDTGPDEGRTRAAEGAPITQVCLEPDSARFKGLAAAVLGR